MPSKANELKLPHMLFYGPPGTGKTSTILALAKSLFGPALYRARILELNASDERGISVVRDKIKNFARTQLVQPSTLGLDKEEYLDKHPCPPFKIIVLDEADSMTQDAQSALRRTMEQYSRITRFCLVCNYVTRIIEPLASRCSKFRFKMLDSSAAGERLVDIVRREGLKVDHEEVITRLIVCSEGDLRRAIMLLQSAAKLVGFKQKKKKKADDDDDDDDDDYEDEEMADGDDDNGQACITVRTVEDVAGVIPESVLDRLIQAIQGRVGSTYGAVTSVVADIIADGWSAMQLLGQLYQRLILSTDGEDMTDLQKNAVVGVFSEMDKRLVDGADEHLSILDLALKIASILHR